jgi:hypothetical protein
LACDLWQAQFREISFIFSSLIHALGNPKNGLAIEEATERSIALRAALPSVSSSRMARCNSTLGGPPARSSSITRRRDNPPSSRPIA